MDTNRGITRSLWVAVILLALIGVAVATRRAIVLAKPSAMNAATNPAAALDEHFAEEKALTLLHVLPGIIFMVLGPLQFVRGLRAKHPAVHRWSGRIFLTASAVIGATGLTMAARGTIGGTDERAAVFLFGGFFLIALAKACWHAIPREFARHREWMIRGYAVGLAVATIRPIMAGVFVRGGEGGGSPGPGTFFWRGIWVVVRADTSCGG